MDKVGVELEWHTGPDPFAGDVGDGLLALFGLDADPTKASRQALRAAALAGSNVDYMNHEFATELEHPVQFGIGIRGGEIIIGDIGFRDHTVFTALGDAVNVAARLQDLTKSLNCTVVIWKRSARTRASSAKSSLGGTCRSAAATSR